MIRKSRSTKKLYGFYRGVVKKQLNNGYCLVQIPGILDYDGEALNNLPPAEPAQGICGGGISTENGVYTYPDVGANVWCFFANGDIRQPIYFATSNSKSVHWDDIEVSQSLKLNEELPGFPEAREVNSSGIKTVYEKSSISQMIFLDPDKKEPEAKLAKIDLKVDRTDEDLERISRNPIVDDGFTGDPKDADEKVNIGSDMVQAGEILVTNASGGSVLICGGRSVTIRAQEIIFDTTNTGANKNGKILLHSGNIELRTSAGPLGTVQVNNSNVKVNIKGKRQMTINGDKDYKRWK